MKTKTCHHCETALQMPWRVYDDNCPECQIRCIANMDCSVRSPVYERIERECGHKAMVIVKERVGLEVVRMRLLKEGKRAVTD
jgi:hypothetical protein